MMNRLLGMMRHAGNNGSSRYRSNAARMVKLNAAVSVYDGSVTRWAACGSDILTRRTMSSTAEEGGATDYDKEKKKKVVSHLIDLEGKDFSTDSWESIQKWLIENPWYRKDEQIRIIFEKWSTHYEKKYPSEAEKEKRFAIFTKKMKHIEIQNSRLNGVTLMLDVYCDLTNEEYLTALQNGEIIHDDE